MDMYFINYSSDQFLSLEGLFWLCGSVKLKTRTTST